jgi:phosphatidylinositol glycan class N
VLTGLFFLLAYWPWIMPKHALKDNSALLKSWSVACIFTSIFTLLPVEKGENINEV